MVDQQSEQTLATTKFGTVTTKRVIYFRNKGWFRGGSREDIPLKHVTSVRLDVSRNVLLGILSFLLSLVFLSIEEGAGIVGIILLGVTVLLLWGSPLVVVNTAGQDRSEARGFPWDREEATTFVEALRKRLVHE